MASLASNGGHVVGKSAVVDRVDTGCNAGLGGSALGQLCHQLGVRSFAAHRGAVFTVQGDVKDTGSCVISACNCRLLSIRVGAPL